MPIVLGLALAACAETGGDSGRRQIGDYKVGKPYQVAGVWHYPQIDYGYRETGIASWYGPGFHGKKTANGETYDQMALTAAHRTLPMPSLVRVTNLDNGRSLVVRINDRGPFKNGRIIDLSRRGARLLGFEAAGTAKVRVEIQDDQSRRLAAIAQGHEATQSAPEAVPTVAVDSAALEPIGEVGTEPVKVAQLDDPDSENAQASHQAKEPKHGPPRPLRLKRRSAAKRASAAAANMATAPVVSRTPVSQFPILAMAPNTGTVADWAPADRPPVARDAALPDGTKAIPWPDGKVSQQPVRATSMFIQAGSFLRRDYATRLSIRLSVLGRSRVTQVKIDGRTFFRVRLGPIASIAKADQMLQVMHSSGFEDARVIVD